VGLGEFLDEFEQAKDHALVELGESGDQLELLHGVRRLLASIAQAPLRRYVNALVAV
jgi:hypothetical protein